MVLTQTHQDHSQSLSSQKMKDIDSMYEYMPQVNKDNMKSVIHLCHLEVDVESSSHHCVTSVENETSPTVIITRAKKKETCDKNGDKKKFISYGRSAKSTMTVVQAVEVAQPVVHSTKITGNKKCKALAPCESMTPIRKKRSVQETFPVFKRNGAR